MNEEEVGQDVELDKAAMQALIAGEEPEAEPEAAEAEGEEVNPVLEEALSKGYNPEGVEGKRNLSPEEFLERGELYDTIHSLKKRSKKQDESIEALKKSHDIVSERAYERAKAELQSQMDDAVEIADKEAVREIQGQMAELETSKVEPVTQEDVQALQADFNDKNDWYNPLSEAFDPDKAAVADKIGTAFQAKNPEKSAKDLFDFVHDEMVKRNKPVNPNRDKPAAVSGAKPAAKKSGTHKMSDVDDPDVLKIARTLIRNGDVTEENWLKSYFGDK